MKTRLSSLNFRPFAVAAAFVLSASFLSAQNVTTDPVGAVVLNLKGGSDTYISLPLHRPVSLEALVQSVSGNVITLQSPVSMTPSQYVYSSPSQTDTFYAQFTSGNRAGSFYTVTANDATTLTINPNNDVNLVNNAAPGDTVRVIPYWTLNTVFPNGQGLYPTTNGIVKSAILLPDNVDAGQNLATGSTYFWFNNGNTTGWRQSSHGTATFPDTPLPPDSLFIVRHPLNTADTQLTITGAVPMSQQATPVGTRLANTGQDNFVGLAIPVDLPLGSSGLYPNIVGGTSNAVIKDGILVFDPTQAAINKSSTTTYYYYTGAANGGPGWRSSADPNKNNKYDSAVLSAGYGFIVRKVASATPSTPIWVYTPPYLAP